MVIPEENIQTILEFVVLRIQEHLSQRQQTLSKEPFILALSGLQGSGKSTYAGQLASTLRSQLHLTVLVCSLDDFYHKHHTLVKIRAQNPSNGLLRLRGQPGTHDEELTLQFFKSLASSDRPLRIPVFDKSKFNGEGGRVPEDDWEVIFSNLPLDVVIFEGWCLGFQPLHDDDHERKWRVAHPKTELLDSNTAEPLPGAC